MTKNYQDPINDRRAGDHHLRRLLDCHTDQIHALRAEIEKLTLERNTAVAKTMVNVAAPEVRNAILEEAAVAIEKIIEGRRDYRKKYPDARITYDLLDDEDEDCAAIVRALKTEDKK